MTIHMPEEITWADALTTPIVVNVFNGSKQSTAKFRVLPEGAWQEMERVDGVDPYYLEMKKLESSLTPPNGITLPDPSITDHLWRSLLPATLKIGTHMIEVEATDVNGKSHVDRQSIRVVDIPRPARKTPPTEKSTEKAAVGAKPR
jgi:C terminal of Calcineurin-like phosphoesterase